MQKTSNYGLVQYETTDKMRITATEDSLNASMEIIDKTLKEKATLNDMTTYIEEHKDELKGDTGEAGQDGYSPTATVTQTETGATITITDKNGTTTTDITSGKDGEKGDTGATGKDGVSATHSWDGTTLTITSASGTSSADLKGEKGDTGETGAAGTDGVGISSVTQTTTSDADGGTNVITVTKTDGTSTTFSVKNGSKGSTGATGATGADGYTPVKGTDYWTEADKTEIKNYVADVVPTKTSQLTNDSGFLTEVELTEEQLNEIAEQVAEAQKIEIVNSVDEMTDTSKQYVLSSTGTVWVYKETTFEQEVTIRDDIKGTEDNPYEAGRFGGDGSVNTDASSTHVITPRIDLDKYSGKTIELHLDGNRYITETQESYIFNQILDAEMNKIYSRNPSSLERLATLNGLEVVINNTNSATLTMTPPITYSAAATPFRYIRFCGLGSEATSDVYITYKETETVTNYVWTDTGVSYGGSGSSVDEETLNKIYELNNEGADPTTIKLLTQPVLDFYNAEDYPDDDYTTTHLTKITYPYRADIPVPYMVKWNYNENAMRTMVAVDTKAIGTVNRFSMFTYDATGLNNYPLYNLIPNKTYFYKVIHILSDGSIVEAKSGSFTTSNETIRLINIDGTQNVRDLGGWTGLDGNQVVYGKIFRGASLSDSSFEDLMLTGKGRLAFAELHVQAELNLGAIDKETSIASNCVYKKIGYSNYATAITDETARANFKTAFDFIVACLKGTYAENGFSTIERNIYMHCQGGCDRTGTLSFLLLGLLGVSESDLAKEYELSSFSDIGIGRLRTTRLETDTYDYAGMVEALKTYNGDTITDKFYDFAVNGCGVSEDTITSFRTLMLEE